MKEKQRREFKAEKKKRAERRAERRRERDRKNKAEETKNKNAKDDRPATDLNMSAGDLARQRFHARLSAMPLTASLMQFSD